MRTIELYVGINICILVVFQRSSARLKQFLKKHDIIANEEVLNELKSLVRREMYEALFLIVLAGLGLALQITISKSYGIWRQVIVYLPIILFALLSLVRRKLENRVRSIPAATEELTQIHHQICKAWRERLLPNF